MRVLIILWNLFLWAVLIYWTVHSVVPAIPALIAGMEHIIVASIVLAGIGVFLLGLMQIFFGEAK